MRKAKSMHSQTLHTIGGQTEHCQVTPTSYIANSILINIIGRSNGVLAMRVPFRSELFHFHAVFGENLAKQEYISVGCVPPACCPYLPACTAPKGGVPGPRGCTWSREVYLVVRGGVPGLKGVPGLGSVTGPGRVYLVQGGYLPRYSPCEQNSWHTLLKIIPCPKLRLRAVILGFHPKLRCWRPCLGNPGSATEHSI